MKGTKVCITCGKEKPATPDFFSTTHPGSTGLRNECKVCRSARNFISKIDKALASNKRISAKQLETYEQKKDYLAFVMSTDRQLELERSKQRRDEAAVQNMQITEPIKKIMQLYKEAALETKQPFTVDELTTLQRGDVPHTISTENNIKLAAAMLLEVAYKQHLNIAESIAFDLEDTDYLENKYGQEYVTVLNLLHVLIVS